MEYPISVLNDNTEKLLKYKADSCRHYNHMVKYLDFDDVDRKIKENAVAVRILENAATDEIVPDTTPVIDPTKWYGIFSKYWLHVCFMVVGYLLHYIS